MLIHKRLLSKNNSWCIHFCLVWRATFLCWLHKGLQFLQKINVLCWQKWSNLRVKSNIKNQKKIMLVLVKFLFRMVSECWYNQQGLSCLRIWRFLTLCLVQGLIWPLWTSMEASLLTSMELHSRFNQNEIVMLLKIFFCRVLNLFLGLNVVAMKYKREIY